MEMKVYKWISLLAIAASVIGLFFKWAKIQFVETNGLSHWSGILILLLGCIALFLVIRDMNKKIILICLFLIPVLALVKFVNLAPILNISQIDLTFSIEIVQEGFFITLISSVISLIAYTAYSKSYSVQQVDM